jgi:hypothetical protein
LKLSSLFSDFFLAPNEIVPVQRLVMYPHHFGFYLYYGVTAKATGNIGTSTDARLSQSQGLIPIMPGAKGITQC